MNTREDSKQSELRLYRVPLIGDGTEGDPIRPNVPEGTSWAGNVLDASTYLIATQDDLASQRNVVGVERSKAAVDAATSRRGALTYEDVAAWSVGDGR